MFHPSSCSKIAPTLKALRRAAPGMPLAILLAWVATACNAAGPTRPFQLGRWSGGAYTNDQTGAFSHCAALVPYNSGIVMLATVNRSFHWSLGFADPRWALTPKAQIPIELHFDGGPAFTVVGSVLAPTVVEVPMPDNSRLINTF